MSFMDMQDTESVHQNVIYGHARYGKRTSECHLWTCKIRKAYIRMSFMDMQDTESLHQNVINGHAVTL